MQDLGDGQVSHSVQRAIRAAREFLKHWRDSFTRNERSDLAQMATITTWRRIEAKNDIRSIESFTRTIVRRERVHALRRHWRSHLLSLEAEPELVACLRANEPAPRQLFVLGQAVDTASLLAALQAVLPQLDGFNRWLLCSYHEGFSVAELADRSKLTEANVKKRLFRSRLRLRQWLETRVRCGLIEGDGDQPSRTRRKT